MARDFFGGPLILLGGPLTVGGFEGPATGGPEGPALGGPEGPALGGPEGPASGGPDGPACMEGAVRV